MTSPLVIDVLEWVAPQLSALPTRRDQAFVTLKLVFGSAVMGAALVILRLEAVWRHCL
jgi:hypothetical protein